MLAYLIVTSLLMLLAAVISIVTFVVKEDNAAFVRAAGELAIAGWGVWLAYRGFA